MGRRLTGLRFRVRVGGQKWRHGEANHSTTRRVCFARALTRISRTRLFCLLIPITKAKGNSHGQERDTTSGGVGLAKKVNG